MSAVRAIQVIKLSKVDFILLYPSLSWIEIHLEFFSISIWHRKMLCIAILFFSLGLSHTFGQQIGTQKQETKATLEWSKCTSSGCEKVQGRLVIDANWRWSHATNSSTNCYTGNLWDKTLCPDDKSCAKNCALEGDDYSSAYGVTTSGDEVNLKFVTHGQYATNVGMRGYLVTDGNNGAQGKAQYTQFDLLNNEFTFDVDVSNVPCGVNSALYFVNMDPDGGDKRFPAIQDGVDRGLGYCDAQCARDLKWIGGESNSEEWVPSKTDPNAGVGRKGACCPEIDIWEGNSISTAFTLHPCKTKDYRVCQDSTCGGTYSSNRYAGDCDPDGCDFNSFRYGDESFFGKVVDPSKKMTVVTQFVAEGGVLTEVRRQYVQNGKIIKNSVSKVAGVAGNSLTPQLCKAAKTAFNDVDYFNQRGGFAGISEAMGKGMTLVFSFWDDHYAQLDWLDSTYPHSKSGPGVKRGTCSIGEGDPKKVEAAHPDSSVTFSNIRFGPIGSTVTDADHSKGHKSKRRPEGYKRLEAGFH